ncbi:MAG: hypothetical protein ABI693_22625 [Bryobacteraceae bacterium]
MLRFGVAFLLALSALFGQYKTAAAGAPGSDIPGPVAALMQKDGLSVQAADGKTLFQIWFRTELPKGAASAEENVNLTTVPHGALVGVVQYQAKGADRRGQTIKPGVYTLRYSMFPVNGEHQGVAPQRDFLLLTPASQDTDLASTPDFATLMKMSMKASGTPHPAVLSLSKDDASAQPGITKDGDTDWTIHSKIGDTPVALVVFGTYGG